MAKLRDLSVSFLSLVGAPATGKNLTLKTASEQAVPFELVVCNDDMMRAYGIVYAPDTPDAHGDTADAETIRRAAAEFMREGRLKNIDTEHSFSAEMAFVAESWLVRKGDTLFPFEPAGAWAVGIQIGDPDLWKKLKSGELKGISLAGVARRDPDPDVPVAVDKEQAPGWLAGLLKALTPKEQPMQKSEVEQIVADALKAQLGPAVEAALKSAAPAPAAAPETQPSGTTPETQPPEAAPDLATVVSKAVTDAMAALEGRLDGKIAKATAKGAIETGDPAPTEESFA